VGGQVEKKLGKRVADLRRGAGLSQAQLAEQLGVATETISRLERGATVPSLATVERLARVLGTDLADLFRFRERSTAKDLALDRLVAIARPRTAEDIAVIADIAARVFERWR